MTPHEPAGERELRAATKRADMPSLAALMEMYQAGMDFIASENASDDGPDRDAMAAILDQIEALIPGEANEDRAARARDLVAKARTNASAYSEHRVAIAPIRGLTIRSGSDVGDGSITFEGHAAVFNQETVLFDGAGIRVREQVDKGAFSKVLKTQPDVHLNINHDMGRVIARTGVDGIGSLALSSDSVGLRVKARLDPNDPDVQALSVKMNRGLIDQMSFAFTIARETRTAVDDGDTEDVLYTIEEIGRLFDVCACAQGAYPQTDAALRSFLTTFSGRFDEGRPSRHDVGSPPVAPLLGRQSPEFAERRKAIARARALLAPPKET